MAFATFCLASAAYAAPDGCPQWMTSSQCDQVLGLETSARWFARVAPHDDEPGEGCVGDDDLNMCARSINKSFANWHWCAGSPKAVRCDIHYCEYDSCFDMSCTISEAYCCASESNDERPDWDTAEAGACEF